VTAFDPVNQMQRSAKPETVRMRYSQAPATTTHLGSSKLGISYD